MDPSDTAKVTFDSTDWLAREGTTCSSYVLTPSATVTVGTNSRTLGVVTAMVTATASGSLTCRFVFADGQVRERTLTITVANL
jgi:hypothetical protein